MGQDQSLQSKSSSSNQLLDRTTQQHNLRRTLSEQHLVKTDERTLINRFHSAIDLKDNIISETREQPTTSSEQDDDVNDEGLINVVKPNNNQQDPILSKLQQLEPVRPLMTNNTRSPFGLENLIDMGSAGMKGLLGKESIRSSSSSSDTLISARMDPLVDILLTLQGHINKHMAQINLNQRRLLQQIKHVDEIGLKTNQVMTMALHQSKMASERLNEAKHIKRLAKETRSSATFIFESLQRIQHLFDPEDRVGHPDFEKRWPVLHSLHQRAITHTGRPPTLLNSSSSTTALNMDDGKTLAASTTISLTNIASVSENSSDNNLEQQHTPDNSSTLVMHRLRSLIGDSNPTTPDFDENDDDDDSNHEQDIYPRTPLVD